MEQDPCQNPEMMEQSVFLPGTENLIQLQTYLGKKHFFCYERLWRVSPGRCVELYLRTAVDVPRGS